LRAANYIRVSIGTGGRGRRSLMRPRSRGRAGRRIGAAVLGLSAFGLALLAAAGHGVWHRGVRESRPRVIHMTLTDTALDPALVVLRPGIVRFDVRNAGHDRRTFAVEGNGILAESADLPPGGSAVVEVGFTRPGTYALLARRPEANPKRSDLTIIP